MSHIVAIGAGQAGAALVARLRKQGFDGQITLIGAEAAPPYQRPPLSKKYLLGEMTRERLFLRPEAWYAEQDIALRLGTRVTAIDPGAQRIEVEGETLAYDELVLTTGSRPNRLPAGLGGDLPRVYTVRDLADIDAMAPEFAEGRRVLIVGGGYIGLEAAAVAAQRGLKVVLIEAAERLLARVACAETAAHFRALHARHGVEIREGCGLEGLKAGPGDTLEAALSDGAALEVDFVVTGIGITPETALAEAAGLACDNGIAVDEMGRTSALHVWAAGDCASFPYRGARIRLESVPHAIEQAEAVADNLTGAGAPYEAKPWFWSDQYDCKLQIAGLNTGYTRVITRAETPECPSFWYYRDDQLLAVDAVTAPRAYMVAKRLIEAGRSPDPAAVEDPSTDLKALLK